MQTAYIGMGGNLPSNVGSPDATLAAAVRRLEAYGRVLRCSSLYSTEPVGFADQPRFVNAVIALETSLDAHALLRALMEVEREFGRDRSAGIQNGPRTLDLDILLFGSELIREPALQVPHPRLAQRAFVLVPLNEIASNVLDVSAQKTVGQLLQDLRSVVPAENDAVLPLESDHWRAGLCGSGDAPVRAKDSDAHH